MRKPVQSLLLGLILGIATISVGYLVSAQLSRKLEALISECHVQNQKPAPVDAPPWAKGLIVCEPQELESSTSALTSKFVGIQASIVETQIDSLAWLEHSRVVGALLFGISALPYCWQFLLRRITELRRALIGR